MPDNSTATNGDEGTADGAQALRGGVGRAARVAHFALDDLLAGGPGVVSRMAWFAHAPHLGGAVGRSAAVPPLGEVSPGRLGLAGPARHALRAEVVDALVDAGLLLAKDGDAALADAGYRALGWHPAAAVAHLATRWKASTARGHGRAGLDSNGACCASMACRRLGNRRRRMVRPMPLPRIARDDFDGLLDTRATCRFDPLAALPLPTFARLMARVFGARGRAPGAGFRRGQSGPVRPGCTPPGRMLPDRAAGGGDRAGAVPLPHRQHALEAVVPQVAPPTDGGCGHRPWTSARAAWTPEALRTFARIAVAD